MTEPWLVFRIGKQQFCTEATQIREIITYREPNSVPGAGEGVEGIITVRNDKITLFSGASLVQRSSVSDEPPGHIILLEDEDGLFGVSVSGVDGITELDPDRIDPSSVSSDNAVLGTTPYDDRLITAVSLLTFCQNAIAAQQAE